MERTTTTLFRAAIIAAVALAAIFISACDKPSGKAPAPEQMAPIAPAPAKADHEEAREPAQSRQTIKFRRNKDNTYSWEIVGDDVDRIVQADKKLRKSTEGAAASRPGWSDEPDK